MERAGADDTIAAAVERLTAAGYTGDFRGEARGLRELRSGRLWAPEDLVVDELVRFEGDTDPASEAAVLALRSRDGAVRGTYAVAYGPAMDAADAEHFRRLGRTPGSRV